MDVTKCQMFFHYDEPFIFSVEDLRMRKSYHFLGSNMGTMQTVNFRVL